MLKTNEINIRDPFVLPYHGVYYMVGTRAKTCWGPANGFDGYRSTDLENWEGPFEIFHRPVGFWADKNYWAPEIHVYQGSFYLFATFNSTESDRKGTMILHADNPLGPYSLHSDGKVTPDNWRCLDGTLYVSPEGIPYLVFSHEWTDIGDGQICCVQLSDDLKRRVSQPRVLFAASDAKPWVKSITNRQWDGPIYVTDGPFLHRRDNGELVMLWATFGEKGYAEAVSRSDNGDITGNWTVDDKPLFDDNGGHGMIFRTFDGRYKLTLHQPNETPKEHPVFLDIDL